MKKKIACFLAVFMVISSTSGYAFAANFEDMPTDWSTPALEAAVANGLLKGDDGKIMPKAFLTRAQMATIVNRAFGTTEKASLKQFNDVATTAWYHDDMAKAVHMEAFKGSGNQLNPDNNITRQEAFVVLARAFKMSTTDTKVLNQFSDKNMVSSWAEEGIAALVANGYVSGSDGKLNPTQNITRAEFAQIMYNLVKTYVKSAETYSQDTQGNVMVNVPGVTLKDMKITGDLIIGDGVGNGEVTLNNVVVTGTTIIRGGGTHSIIISDHSDLGDIIVARVDGEVRVFAEDGTQVGTVVVDGKDDVIIEGEVEKVFVEATDITVIAKSANFESVTVDGAGSKVVADEKTTIEKVTVNAQNAEIVSKEGTTIKKVIVNQDGVEINGSGSVDSVDANANNIVVETSGTDVTAAEGTKGVKAGDETVNAGETGTVSDNSNNGGGGGGGSHSSNETVSILSKPTLGMPTSEVKVQVDGSYVDTFDLYFDGSLLVSTSNDNGKVVVASAVLQDLSRVEIKIDGELKSDSNMQLGTWSE